MFIERSAASPMSWLFRPSRWSCRRNRSDPGGVGDREAAGRRRERIFRGDAYDDLSAALRDFEIVDAVLLRPGGRSEQEQA